MVAWFLDYGGGEMTYTDTAYVIVNGGAYVRTIDPVSGAVRWTENQSLAKVWSTRDLAEMFADGVGYVRPVEVVRVA